MGLLIASVFGVILWIILWALGAKSIDAFLLTILIFLIAAAGRVIGHHRNRRREQVGEPA